MKHAKFASFSALVIFMAHAAAAKDDPRIRDIQYDPGKVVRITGCLGFETMIELADEEFIENVGIGDAAQWLVSPNKRANILFVKPALETAHTNLTVSTDRRRYNFELVAKPTEACSRGDVTYNLRFQYPQDAAPPSIPVVAPEAPPPAEPETPMPPPDQRHANYSFTGAVENIPQRVFDTGRATFFRWTDAAATPAVYAVASDKSETLVNFTTRGDYLVIEQTAPAFILRRGKAVAILYNDSYQAPVLDADSPQPRAKNKRDKDDIRLVDLETVRHER